MIRSLAPLAFLAAIACGASPSPDVTAAELSGSGSGGSGSGRRVFLASAVEHVNGRTGAGNPERQGLSSALLDGLSPLNVLRWAPNQGRYSPLWDVFLAAWTPDAIARGEDLRQDDFGDILGLAADGLVTAPDGGRFRASGFIVNCPIISSE